MENVQNARPDWMESDYIEAGRIMDIRLFGRLIAFSFHYKDKVFETCLHPDLRY